MELHQIQPDENITEEVRAGLVDLLVAADGHYNPFDVEDDIDNGELFSASEDDENIGVAVLRITRVDGILSGRVDNLSIVPEYQGMGYGTQVIKQFATTCLARGVRSLHTIAATPEAQQFYAKQGFSPKGTIGAVGVLMHAELRTDHSN